MNSANRQGQITVINLLEDKEHKETRFCVAAAAVEAAMAWLALVSSSSNSSSRLTLTDTRGRGVVSDAVAPLLSILMERSRELENLQTTFREVVCN